MFDILFIGLSVGAVLLLIALGLAITYGSMGIINMAHGEMVMLGAYTAVLARIWLDLGLLASIPLAFILTSAIGLVIERAVVRRLYGRMVDTLLATWGIAILLQQAIRLNLGLTFFGLSIEGMGPSMQKVDVPTYLSGVVHLAGVDVNVYRSFVIIITALLAGLTWWVLLRTSFGLKVRAIMASPSVAAASGIDIRRTNALTFAFGSGLAGIAGVILAGFKTVSPDMGTSMVVDGFLVVVMGGLGSLAGAVLAAGLLGEINSVVAYFSTDVVGRAFVFLTVIAVLVARPSGLSSFRGR